MTADGKPKWTLEQANAIARAAEELEELLYFAFSDSMKSSDISAIHEARAKLRAELGRDAE